ncbi:iron-containing alcohol dehydrogenase [Lacisediminihabitans profunda]|uniref:Iron-containing alcohol dehydrogenase n=1 Tax=Lacisediminihabitans profunda TaxID=2594790 RepID=A0A5C8UWA6_9MICO|nr:iron-containing alcohol dehydrogenase [Lacisediminihabitans profunda]TXN32652.1 iron-containing alcohol dehydrogenase [Lacisediminihabitans profunda]
MASIENDLGLGLLRQPKTVLFGAGQRRQLPYLVKPLGSHVLICTDSRMATTAEYAEIAASLTENGIAVSVYSDVEPDLPRSNVVDIQRRFGSEQVDVVIGLGGGSCLDMAKVAGLMLSLGGDIRDYFGENLVPRPGLPVITIPTTGGTGAEVTCIAVVFDDEKHMKVGVASAYLEAVAAIIDPELTLSCPPGLTAATGADALSHLIESFTDRAKNPSADDIDQHLYVGKNVLTDVYCRTGIELLGRSLEAVVADPSDLQARADTMFAAYCAGMAINTAGTAAAHAIQSPIGNLTHSPHGIGVGALLPYVMRFNLPARVAVFAEIGRLLGVADAAQPELDQAHAAIERVEQILSILGVPGDLKELGLEPKDFEFVAQQAMLATRLTSNNPRVLTENSIVALLERGYANDRSWWVIE